MLVAAALLAGCGGRRNGPGTEDRLRQQRTRAARRDPAKAAQAKLEAEFCKREKDLTDLASRLKAAADKLEKDAPTLAEAERTAASASWSSRTATSSASAASSRKT